MCWRDEGTVFGMGVSWESWLLGCPPALPPLSMGKLELLAEAGLRLLPFTTGSDSRGRCGTGWLDRRSSEPRRLV